MSIPRARRRSLVPTATPWCRACAPTATGRSSRSTAPATPPNGPMRCRASSLRSARWRDAHCHRQGPRMTFPDVVPELKARVPELRGRLLPNQSLAELTWFRVGGPAQVLFMPEDEADLAYVLQHLPAEIPVTVIGLGSNLIVRDGGVPGVVIRLGRGFGEVKVAAGGRVRAGAAVPDVKVSRAAQEAGLAGLAFFRGIPGAVGGVLRMNGGAYGRETKDALIEARGVDREGRVRVFSNGDMHYNYRHCGAPDDVIFTEALFQGAPGDPATDR